MSERSLKTEVFRDSQNNVLPYYEILDYDKLTAEYNAQIISTLRKRGIQIPILDSQIAATALAHNLILITRNSKDFVQIQDFFPLKIENWF